MSAIATTPTTAALPAAQREARPYHVGERVRCAISTVGDLDGLELHNRLGTVVYAEPFPDDNDAPAWLLGVVWDGVDQYLRIYHTGDDVDPYLRITTDVDAA